MPEVAHVDARPMRPPPPPPGEVKPPTAEAPQAQEPAEVTPTETASQGGDSSEQSQHAENPRANEIKTASDAIITTKIADIVTELNGLNDADRVQAAQDQGKGALLSLNTLQNSPDLPTDFQGTLTVVSENGEVTVTKVISTEASTVICTIEGQEDPVTLPRQALVDGQLVAESDNILSQFPEGSAERTVVEARIKAIKGEQIPAADTPEGKALSEAVQKATEPPTEEKAADTPVKEQSPVDLVIATQASTLEAKIKAAQARGEKSEADEQTLKLLRIAQTANGEVGILLKVRALNALGMEELNDTIVSLEPQAVEAGRVLIDHLKAAGISQEQAAALVKAGLDVIVTSGMLDKIPDLEKLVFGRELNDGELDTLLNSQLTPERKRTFLQEHPNVKKAGFAALLLLLMGGMAASSIMKS